MAALVINEKSPEGLFSSADIAFGLAVGIFPAESAVDKTHGFAEDVVAKPETAEAQSVLSFSGFDAFEFLYGVSTARVVWVSFENFADMLVNRCEFRMAFEQLFYQPFVVGCYLDGKG